MRFPGLAIALLLAAPALGAGDVHVVDAAGGADFTDIQPAVVAAVDGDTILVKSGQYGPVSIVHEGLTIVGDKGEIVSIVGGLRVQDTLVEHTVVLANLRILGEHYSSLASEHGIVGFLVRGPLRVEDCVLKGDDGLWYTDTNDHGGYGADIRFALDVSFVGCTLQGGDGGGTFDSTGDINPAGHGLRVENVTVALHDTTSIAGDAQEFDIFTCDYGGKAGHGVYSIASELYASGSHMEGGLGGTEGLCAVIYPGGDGLRLESISHGEIVGCVTLGGPQNVCFAPAGNPTSVEPGSTLTVLTDLPRSMRAPTPLRELEAATFEFQGEPGDKAFLLLSATADHMTLPTGMGPLLIGVPLLSQRRFMGTVPGTRTLSKQLVAPPFATGDSVNVYLQSMFQKPSGQVWFASPSVLVILDPGF